MSPRLIAAAIALCAIAAPAPALASDPETDARVAALELVVVELSDRVADLEEQVVAAQDDANGAADTVDRLVGCFGLAYGFRLAPNGRGELAYTYRGDAPGGRWFSTWRQGCVVTAPATPERSGRSVRFAR